MGPANIFSYLLYYHLSRIVTIILALNNYFICAVFLIFYNIIQIDFINKTLTTKLISKKWNLILSSRLQQLRQLTFCNIKKHNWRDFDIGRSQILWISPFLIFFLHSLFFFLNYPKTFNYFLKYFFFLYPNSNNLKLKFFEQIIFVEINTDT